MTSRYPSVGRGKPGKDVLNTKKLFFWRRLLKESSLFWGLRQRFILKQIKSDHKKTDFLNAVCEDDVQYYVKWRGQPYEESTWETWSDLKNFTFEVWRFWEIQQSPKSAIKLAHPSVQDYHKLIESPNYGESSSIIDNIGTFQLRDYQLEGVNWLLWNW